MYPWVFTRQPLTLSHMSRRETVEKLFFAIEQALEDGIKPPVGGTKPRLRPSMFEEMTKPNVTIAAAGSRETSTENAVLAAAERLDSKLKGSTPSLILAAFTCTHDAETVASTLAELYQGIPVAGITTCRGVVLNGQWLTHRKEYACALWSISDDAGEYAVTHVHNNSDVSTKPDARTKRRGSTSSMHSRGDTGDADGGDEAGGGGSDSGGGGADGELNIEGNGKGNDDGEGTDDGDAASAAAAAVSSALLLEEHVDAAVTKAARLRNAPPSFVLIFGSPGDEEHVIKAIGKAVGQDIPILGGSSGDNKVLGQWRQISMSGSTAWGASEMGVTSNGVVLVLGWSSCVVSTTLTSGFGRTEHCGKVTKVDATKRTILTIDDQPAASVYKEWAGDTLTAGLEEDANGNLTILSTSSCMPLAEPLRVQRRSGVADEGNAVAMAAAQPLPTLRSSSRRSSSSSISSAHFRVMHPAHINSSSGGVTTFADACVGMEIVMLAAAPESLARKVSQSALELLQSELVLTAKRRKRKADSHSITRSNSFQSNSAVMHMDECIGSLMIFCGGMVMTIDDEMPLACEDLAGVVNHTDTMGICCFGEQGVGADRKAKHGNLMFGCLAFLNQKST